jgi:N utilization substance protein B
MTEDNQAKSRAPGRAGGGSGGASPRRGGGGGAGAGRRPRTGARVAAVQALYQSEANGEPAEAVIDQFVRHRLGRAAAAGGAADGFEEGGVPEADVPLFTALVRRVAQNGEAVDGLLVDHLSRDWPLDRLDPVLRALLRAACAELWAGKEPPARVVINEYLDIAHGFFGGEEPRFANGVMDALARRLRPEEFERTAAGPKRGDDAG